MDNYSLWHHNNAARLQHYNVIGFKNPGIEDKSVILLDADKDSIKQAYNIDLYSVKIYEPYVKFGSDEVKIQPFKPYNE